MRRAFARQVRSGAGPEAGPEGLSPALCEAALVAHAAFAAPWRIRSVMDGVANRRRGASEVALDPGPEPGRAVLPVPDKLFAAFWAVIDGAGSGRSALEFTQATAALGGWLDPGFQAAHLAVCRDWPGVAEAAAQGWPEPFTLEQLAAAPLGSLASDFHRLIVENGFDLEVLDRDALSLRDLPAPLDYLNARILQVHDLWHLVGGYRTTGLHEIAISAFQLAQFGHAYSGFVLAVTLASVAGEPDRHAILSGVIAQAWRHGRVTPPLMGVDWPAVWNRPVEAVRSALGVEAFTSPWPADLFERAA